MCLLWLSAGIALHAANPPADTVTLTQPLHFDVDLVQVDAIVTDSHGNRVPDLKADDFEVYQDKKRQRITHFVYVPVVPPEGAPISPKVAPRQLTAGEARRVFLIFIDDRDMSFAEFAAMRRGLRTFIDTDFQYGDLCAFYRTSGGPGAWRAFSSDPQQAHAALDHMTWLRPPLVYRNPLILQSRMEHALADLSGMPGRKALIMVNAGVDSLHSDFDSGIRTRVLRNGEQLAAPGALGVSQIGLSYITIARQIADAANRASVAVYAIDARGVKVLSPTAADDFSQLGGGSEVAKDLAMQHLNATISYVRSQEFPKTLADMTGGLAFHDTNDLLRAIRDAADDEHDYYLLGWTPADKTFDLKGTEVRYHSLRIRVRRPGLSVRTRAGFFGLPQGQRTHLTARTRMTQALTSPFHDDDIAVELTASLQTSAAQGPHIQCLMRIGPKGMNVERNDRGCLVAHFDVAFLPQRLGQDLDESDMHGQLATMEACGPSADQMLRDGFVFTADQPIAPGAYEMHVVVRNTEAGEAPVLGPKRLITDSDPNAPHRPVHIGSASEFVYAPDPHGSELALSGITIGLKGAKPHESTDNPSWHLPAPGDAAVRDFYPGDPITYQATLIGRSDGALPENAQLQVLYEGKPIYTEAIHPDDGGVFRGAYQLDMKAPLGQYLLGIIVPAKRGKDKAAVAAQEWINFQVIR